MTEANGAGPQVPQVPHTSFEIDGAAVLAVLSRTAQAEGDRDLLIKIERAQWQVAALAERERNDALAARLPAGEPAE